MWGVATRVRGWHGRTDGRTDVRLGLALLCRSFFLRVLLMVRLCSACGPSSVTSLVSFL